MRGRGWIMGFCNNRWVVFVAAMWLQSCGGIGYLFGSISPVIKTSLKYNQREIARLGVAKDLGDSVGFLAGSLFEILPMWAALLIGALQNLVGYGWVWLIVTARSPSLPLWAMCILIFVGTNGETYINTAALVSCVQNFPKSRGPVVGILKGFAGLGGAILTQTYALVHSPDHASLIFMVAVAPALVTVALMFFVRPVGGQRQVHPSDGKNFALLYTVCLVLASYLMTVMLLQDMIDFTRSVVVVFVGVMFILLLIPAGIPLWMTAFPDQVPESEASPLLRQQKQVPESPRLLESEVVLFSEVEEEKPKDVDLLPELERRKRMAQLQVRLMHAAAEGAVRVKRRRRGPRRGEDFTLTQALIKADFWLIFFSLLLGSGSGLTVIDNIGQMSQSLGYDNSHIFVSMISIWNFLGRVGGGYFSEVIVREHAYPRPVAMAGAQFVMAVGHIFVGMGWPGAMYIGTLMIGLGYGAHWAIVPAAASELFGLKKFGALYNFLTLANPAGSLIFSGVLASSLYDYEAERQAERRLNLGVFLSEGDELRCEGAVCFFITSMVLSGLCFVAVFLSLVLVHRTKTVYSSLYGNSLS